MILYDMIKIFPAQFLDGIRCIS